MFQTVCRTLAVIFIFTVPLTVAADCMGPYPPSMVRAFNQNCATDSSKVAFCTCLLDQVQKTIPLADFIEIGNSVNGLSSDPRFMKASASCSPQMPGGKQSSGQQGQPQAQQSTPARPNNGLANPVH